jgi:enoyl-CoA hydratase
MEAGMREKGDVRIEAAADGIARLVLNRAPVNALTAGFLDHVASALAELVHDAATRAIIVSSAFRTYSGGLDLKAAQAMDLAGEQAIVRALNVTFSDLYRCPKPVIAACSGSAIAGGLFFVLAADWRVGAEDAAFGLAEVRVGADFPVGPLEIARDTLAPAAFRRLLLSGQPIQAAEALAQGILDETVPHAAVEFRALEAARRHAALPPGAFARVKAQSRKPALDRIDHAMATGANAPPDGWLTAESRPAMAAMIASRRRDQ